MQILIQHTSGSKANRTDHFDTDSVSEITFGRDQGSSVAYDPIQDDDVSRSHAVLRVRKDNGIAFLLRDNNSSNGTRVNGQRITDEVQLLPEDKVEFGVGGPSFVFDLQPRPASLMARTRVIPNATAASANTRMVTSAPPPSTASQSRVTSTMASATMASGRPGIGRDTVLGLLQQERQATSRVWMVVTVVILAVVGLGGGALYWRMMGDRQQTAMDLADANRRTADLMQTQQAQKDAHELLQQKVGVAADEIVRSYANSTVQINVHWRLYDKVTGKPAFQKAVTCDKIRYRAYVRMPDRTLVPWLTTEGEGGTNFEMQVTGTGSGFVVGEDGFIITNKHVAAGWLAHYLDLSDKPFIVTDLDKKGDCRTGRDMTRPDRLQIEKWIPSDSVYTFDATIPRLLDRTTGTTEGRNDLLEVQFPGGSRPIGARLVRASAQADIALVKIDMPKKFAKVPFAGENPPAVGGAVTVMGYPCACLETVRLMTTNEAGDIRTLREIIPEPTVVSGTIARLSDPIMQRPEEVVLGMGGDLYVLNAAADQGNSGGPVFDSAGKVIAVLTYGTARETVTEAVPIKYAKALLE